MDRIIATLRRRIERVGRDRHQAFESDRMVDWKRAADRGNTLRAALMDRLTPPTGQARP